MEVWKDIKGYEGRYQASNLGRIKSLNYNRENIEKILEPARDKDGYLVVCLYKNGVKKNCRVHRVIAETFLLENKELPCIKHKDENKQNNRVDNLEYCTIEYNNRYSKNVPIEQCDLNGNVIRIWNSIKEASRSTKIKAPNISACCRKYGRNKTAGGYIWRYMTVI